MALQEIEATEIIYVKRIWEFLIRKIVGVHREISMTVRNRSTRIDEHETINLVTKSTEERKGREEHIIRTNKYSVHCAPVKYPMKKKRDGEEQRRNNRSNR